MRLLQYLNCKNRGSCSRTFRIVGEEDVDDGVSWAEAAGSTHQAKHANTSKEFACCTHPMLDPGATAEVCIFYDNGDCISVCNTIGLHGAARVQR